MEKAEKAKEKLDKQVKSDLLQIARVGIDEYYDSYDREYYKPWGDLYKIFKVVINDDEIILDYNYDLMIHHKIMLRKYIFDYMFLQGYHGGAVDGDNHPASGIPWYRGTAKNSNKYAFWTTPSIQTDAPYDVIESESKKYIDKVIDGYENKYVIPIQKLIYEMNQYK